ncbi:MAG: hypothetical protein M0D54_03985 [Hyphomonadaceae bacterium JAD_PAG50586_4]|nr:MAG: hypothetical protein M0D54_03985 [Hyphomonadaceae bacterium JAD_PAG50586_4]
MSNDPNSKPLGRVLILVENLPVPFDRRVWMEASSLHAAGYEVNVICPKGKGYDKGFERIDGIYVYRYSLPIEASGFAGYLFEYPVALISSFVLTLRVAFARGIDVIHACNPPDLLFLVAAPSNSSAAASSSTTTISAPNCSIPNTISHAPSCVRSWCCLNG